MHDGRHQDNLDEVASFHLNLPWVSNIELTSTLDSTNPALNLLQPSWTQSTQC